MHLDSLARRPKNTGGNTSTAKVAAAGGSTVQSVYAATATPQPSSEAAAAPAVADPTTALTQGGGSGGKPKPTARVEVTTIAQAREVAAKRKANLESKKLDKCPLCKQQHEYDKEWPQVTPATKVKMVSTLLSSCPQFGAQPPDQKLVTVTAHAACPLCTSWEHTRHKFGGRELPEPRCKVLVAGTECGGSHGRWFHATDSNTGNLVSAPPAADTAPTPGLFEGIHSGVRRTRW